MNPLIRWSRSLNQVQLPPTRLKQHQTMPWPLSPIQGQGRCPKGAQAPHPVSVMNRTDCNLDKHQKVKSLSPTLYFIKWPRRKVFWRIEGKGVLAGANRRPVYLTSGAWWKPLKELEGRCFLTDNCIGKSSMKWKVGCFNPLKI